MNAIVPLPQIDVSVRPATVADVPFVDQLQKLHCRQVGFMRTSWIEAKIGKGEVMVAEENVDCGMLSVDRGCSISSQLSTINPPQSPTPVGYCMGVDRYFKRDDVGIIHQMNIAPGRQRSLVGATLLKAMFDRAAYGCRLFCCWCSQDLAANRFWEAMGFVPLAYRAGSEKRDRVHIFWQKRIREGDNATPWWFPAKTDGGVMREDRLVLPIPPGVHWSDEMPVILRPVDTQTTAGANQPPAKTKKKPLPLDPPTRHGPRQYGAPPAKPVPPPPVEKPKREKTPKAKTDPKLIAAARELRDRWLEQVNANPAMIGAQPKYAVNRIAGPVPPAPPLLLPDPLAA